MRTYEEWQEADMGDEAEGHKAGLQWDPEVAAIFNEPSEAPQVQEWRQQNRAVYLTRKEIENKVRGRVDRAIDLDCKPHERVRDVYHVTGGKDPDGHTVDLRAEWGLRCTCGHHMMAHAFCKHLIRVGFERGEYVYDRWPSFAGQGAYFKPGLISRAVQVDLENAAYRAAKATEERKNERDDVSACPARTSERVRRLCRGSIQGG